MIISFTLINQVYYAILLINILMRYAHYNVYTLNRKETPYTFTDLFSYNETF